jgi:kynureninase
MFTRQDALDLDAKDPLAKYRDLFVFTDPEVCYLDGNSLGRLPKSTVETVNKFLDRRLGNQDRRRLGRVDR